MNMKVYYITCTVLSWVFVSNVLVLVGSQEIISNPTLKNHHKLLLISMDGFSQQYVNDAEKLEAFSFLASHGSKSKFMRPPFPSQTSPSHTTLASGLYVENHNVVHNCYYDWHNGSIAAGTFYSTLAVNEWWDNGYENIWVTASKQGLKSGGYLYPGSNATLNGYAATRSILETIVTPKEEDDWRNRIDEVMDWFANDNFDFIALYFENPDLVGHDFGPDSDEIRNNILPLLNRTIGYLIEKVVEYGLQDNLNVILASDHGMANINTSVPREDTIQVMKYINDSSLVSFQLSYGPLGLIEPTEGNLEEVYNRLKGAHPHMAVYYREELLERWHYKNSDRLPSIVMVSDPGYSIYRYFPYHINAGEHGYDNIVDKMKTIFYGIGPSFKEGFVLDGFDSIHVYSLMCHLLGLQSAPNNGTLDTLYPALKYSGGVSLSPGRNSIVVAFLCSVLCINNL